ncbi:MAG: hypothetical protein WD063_10140 [Pirellulales bacterium]
MTLPTGHPTSSWWQLLKQAASDLPRNKTPRLGAALAYYTLFSIAPLLVIVVSNAGWVFGAQAMQALA